MFEVCYVVGMVLCALSVKEVIFIAQGVCFIVMVLGPCILAIQLVLKNTPTTTTDIVCCFINSETQKGASTLDLLPNA